MTDGFLNVPPVPAAPSDAKLVSFADRPVTATIQVLGKFVEALGQTIITPDRK
jgi:hypothetical protein